MIKFIANNKNRFDQGVGMFEGLLDERNRHASVDVTSINIFVGVTDRSMSCETHHQVYKNYKLSNSHVRDIEHKLQQNNFV